MARIIYGVCGEGMGHANRSAPIIEYLSKKNDVTVFSSDRAYGFLSKRFDDVREIDGLNIRYKNNSVARSATLISNIKKLPKLIASLRKINRAIDESKPDLMISDFDIVTAYAAMINRIPLISIDNQHICQVTRIKLKKRHLIDYLIARAIIRIIMPSAKYRIVTTFFYPDKKSDNAFLISPVLRKEVLDIKPDDKGYILVYQTSDSNKNLVENLKKVNEKFIVYGFHKNHKDGNVELRENDSKKFLMHLSGCKAVITNGGFTLISEALHLGKPVLSIPVKRQFEQILNAIYLDKLGYGKSIGSADEKNINEFINNLDMYKENLKRYRKGGDSMDFRILDRLIA